MLTTRVDSFSSDDGYDDEILRLARDPELNRQQNKTSRIILLIQNFSLAERKVSRLCQLSLKILQTLEKIELNLKNWAFLSLDINSTNHFDAANTDEIKLFNTNISVRVLTTCQDLTVKLNKVSADIDFITKALRTLTPIEYISDSGTLLTSLTLRSIRLKDELRRKVTIAYLKATLITIGSDLESMLCDEQKDQQATISSYKQFVVSLLGQLNQAIEDENDEDVNECFAVISDMEQMFEVFKFETAQKASKDLVVSNVGDDCLQNLDDSCEAENSMDSSEGALNDDLTWTSQGTAATSYLRPMVRSITKPSLADNTSQHRRTGLVSSFASTNALQRSTITEELPYLMSAFNLAKTLEEDMHHYKENSDEESSDSSRQQATAQLPSRSSAPSQSHFLDHRGNLPNTSLYSSSQILNQPLSSPSSYLFANNSLLSKLGIKPQVITANLPSRMSDSSLSSTSDSHYLTSPSLRTLEPVQKDTTKREKDSELIPLTKENLATHNLTALTAGDIDIGPDYVE